MKHYYRYIIFFLLTAALFTGFVLTKKAADRPVKSPAADRLKWQPPVKPKPNAVPEAEISQIQQGLVQREYYITFDQEKQALQSPNRKHNLRAYYKPGVLSVQNRKDSAGHNFRLKLVNEGIYADGRKIYTPDAGAKSEEKDNQLNINHTGFTEQYINSESGVRQNFIVHSAPKAATCLQVRLLARGLKVNDVGGNELHFYTENQEGGIEKQLIYKDLKCWDANGKPLLASLAYQDEKILINVNVADALYPVTIDPIVVNGNPGNANSLLESNQAGANAGYAVSSAGDVNGDGYSDVLVGAPAYDKGETNEGVVFVYYGSATGLGANPALVLEGNQAEARFGHSVSTAGDVNKDGISDVIIGAPYFDKGQTNEGAVFLFHGSLAGLKANAAKILESNQAEAHFGNAAALAGDVNGDGYSDVIVGAPWYDKGQTDEGAAFVYHGSAAGVGANAAFTIESNQVAAKLGNAVAGAGDVNGDGYSDVVVGSFWYDKGQVNEGAAFVYHGSALGIAGNAASILESNQADAVLGFSVASAGDVNGDGYSDVIVGAYLYDHGQSNEGAAFVYQGSAAGVSVNASVILEINQEDSQFGYSVASAGDVNGDGYSDVIVGANTYDKGEANEGAAFVYQGSSVGVYANAVSTLESDQVNAGMGIAVSSAGDVNGDGYSDVIAGASLFDKGEVDEGAGFVWFGMAAGVDFTTAISLEANQQDCLMGWSVSSAGDVNGDGYGDLVIGAPNFDNGQTNEGVAFVFYGSVNGLNLQSTKLEKDVAFAEFGFDVSNAGDVNNDGYEDILVGAPYQSPNNDIDEGAAYIFYGSVNGISNNSFKVLVCHDKGAQFGISTSGAGDINNDGFSDILIGAIWYTAGQHKEGAVFIYYGSATGINEFAAQKLESNQAYSEWGSSISDAGDLNGDGFGDIAIAAPQFINSQSSPIPQGAVFIYYGSSNGVNLASVVKLQIDQNNAFFGKGVSKAGDLNGDGYGDLMVGASHYDNIQINKGAVFVYYGSSEGLSFHQNLTIENNLSNEYFGNSLCSIGDLNGDGYSDVIIGAPGFQNNNQPGEGAAYVYCGSPLGLNLNSKIILEVNKSNAKLGWSVSSAGDANGDGFSDMIVGAPFYDISQLSEGAAFIYYGNNGQNLRNNLRLYNSDLATNINHTQFTKNNFGAGLFAKSFLGRGKGALVWETKAKGQAFSKGANEVITNSTQFTNRSLFTNMGLTGTEIKSIIPKQGPATKLRVRVKYDPTVAITGQTYGPWRYLPAYLTGSSIAPVPENAMAETIRKKFEVPGKNSFAETITIYPNPVSDKLNIESKNPEEIGNVQLLTTQGRSLYKSTKVTRPIDVQHLEPGVYILLLTHIDGTQVSKKVMIRR